ncbi:MAG: phosphoadenylyl-sulfate reductase [Armatimonadetes bacterium]|nr:phosphoadenylyl-sulfate reductase [Armatimonadota bacterium]
MTLVASHPDVAGINRKLGSLSAPGRIAWAIAEYGAGLTFACSFGAEDMVVLDLLERQRPGVSLFVLDTGRLHEETYALIEEARRHYGRSFETYAPQTVALERLLWERGPNSFHQSVEARKACCAVRKVEPLSRALAGRSAWMTGLRRAQAVTRAELPFAEVDDAHGGIVKLNPLADWSEGDVWAYLRAHGVPRNALHDRGFPSIGCEPCTRAVAPGEDLRSGRWWWEAPEQKECGLHARGEG